MKKIYLSGPMTGKPNNNSGFFNAEAERLRALGYGVVNPAEINVNTALTWEEYLKADLKQMLDCDTIAFLPGWLRSRGARLEHRVARELSFNIVYAEDIVFEQGTEAAKLMESIG